MTDNDKPNGRSCKPRVSDYAIKAFTSGGNVENPKIMDLALDLRDARTERDLICEHLRIANEANRLSGRRVWELELELKATDGCYESAEKEAQMYWTLREAVLAVARCEYGTDKIQRLLEIACELVIADGEVSDE